MSHPAVDELRRIDLFEGLDDAALADWAQAAEIRELAPGETIAEQGRTVPAFHLVLSGTVEASAIDSEGRADPMGRHEAPTWVGAIAVLTGGVSGVRMQCLTPVTVADIEPERFLELVRGETLVFERVMSQVRPVVGHLQAVEQNRERLASLGTMAAGLAHELNNPAAAAQRASQDLARALEVLSSTIGHFVESGIERGEAQQLVELQREVLARASTRTPLDTLDAADAEEALLAALEALGVPEPWILAEALARGGVDEDWLARVRELAGAATPAALQWVAASLAAGGLVDELAQSTAQISQLVSAVKSYAYMDQGERLEVDVHEGLEATLAVLAHKLKHTEITVRRDYDRSLPKLTVYAGELNQVWTNLIDNAIYALGDHGTLTLTTVRDGECIRVDVADDGAGIPQDAREHIFDPFFTTKEVGQGAGLGLDTTRRIVADRHRGSIDFESEPGRTVFHVWLPLQENGGADDGLGKPQVEGAR